MESEPRMERSQTKTSNGNHCPIKHHKESLTIPQPPMKSTSQLSYSKARADEDGNCSNEQSVNETLEIPPRLDPFVPLIPAPFLSYTSPSKVRCNQQDYDEAEELQCKAGKHEVNADVLETSAIGDDGYCSAASLKNQRCRNPRG